MARMKLTRRQFPFTPGFLPSPLLSAFGDFGDLNETTQQLFDEVFGKEFARKAQGWAPAVNMAESKDEYTVTAELPGAAPPISGQCTRLAAKPMRAPSANMPVSSVMSGRCDPPE